MWRSFKGLKNCKKISPVKNKDSIQFNDLENCSNLNVTANSANNQIFLRMRLQQNKCDYSIHSSEKTFLSIFARLMVLLL